MLPDSKYFFQHNEAGSAKHIGKQLSRHIPKKSHHKIDEQQHIGNLKHGFIIQFILPYFQEQ